LHGAGPFAVADKDTVTFLQKAGKRTTPIELRQKSDERIDSHIFHKYFSSSKRMADRRNARARRIP
jgi:hypothetical protein